MNDSDRNESSRLAVLTSRQSRLSALVGGCVLVLATSGAAHAKTVNVNSTCTLAEAFQTVNTQVAQPGCTFTGTANPDLILVPSGTFTQTTSLELNRSATVRGNGVGVTILRGNSTSYFLRAVDLNPPVSTNALTVTFEQMTIDHTTSSVVNGIYANQVLLQVLKARVTGFKTSGIWGDDADMLIEDSTIENNTSSASGGGVLFLNPLGSQATKNASLHVNRSTIANNSASASGGGLYYSGWGNSALTNVTISGNHAVDGAGVSKDPAPQYLFFYNCTVANNTATNHGGGLSTLGGPSGQGNKLIASIVGQNAAPNGPDVWGPINEFDESLIGNSSGANISINNGIIDVSPNLDLVLRDLGGPYHTKVHRPFPSSPVIDAVTTFSAPEDQRKVLRPQFGQYDSTLGDMGAFENTRIESEIISVAANSPDPYLWVSGSQYSNGQGNNLQAAGLNSFVTYVLANSLPVGTYNVKIGIKKGNNEGKFQLGHGTSWTGPFTPVGPVVDGYGFSSSWVTIDLGNVTLGSTTTYDYFQFLVIGKNTSSAGYQIFLDFIEITRQ